MSTAALILAAGESKRFGAPKQLAVWQGRPLLEHVVERVRGWPQVQSVYVVLGSRAEQIMETVDLSQSTVVENLDWAEGVASSLRAGLDALIGDRTAERALIALGDQPLVPDGVIPRLLEAGRRCGRPVVIPRYRFVRGHPVLVDRSLWPRLIAGVAGDLGARNLFLAHPEWVEEVLVAETAPRDIDTQEDLDDLHG
ncbi:MAG: nucleotidyltransferase family protein [bacterium]|nr:nucleotidyltransferase family protein [bacterium]MDE0289661.1 nucleotidyltransferase family protein [bacterium]MDE0437935.1 nucleotidyltransferase family protein [bacterium]